MELFANSDNNDKFTTIQSSTKTLPNLEVLLEAIDGTLNRIRVSLMPIASQQEAFDRTLYILNDSVELKKLRMWTHEMYLLAQGTPDGIVEQQIRQKLAEKVRLGNPYTTLWEHLKPRGTSETMLVLLELILATIHLSHDRLETLVLAAPFALHGAYKTLQWLGYEPQHFQGDRWPQLIARGDSKVFQTETEKIIAALLN